MKRRISAIPGKRNVKRNKINSLYKIIHLGSIHLNPSNP